MLLFFPFSAFSLVTVGSTDASHAFAAPVVLSDIFARVGGPDDSPVAANTMVHIKASNVVGDNLWLWRADHTATGLVYAGENPCAHGLVVDGDDVAM